MNQFKKIFSILLSALLCLSISAPAYSCAVVVAVIAAVDAGPALTCKNSALSLVNLFSHGVTPQNVCNGLGAIEGTYNDCCQNKLILLAADKAGYGPELFPACNILHKGAPDFLQGFCNGGTGNAQHSCGADIKAIYHHLDALNALASGKTIPSSVCKALKNVLGGTTCCNSEVKNLFTAINNYTHGSMGTYVSALDTLCKDNNGQIVLDIIVGMDCDPSPPKVSCAFGGIFDPVYCNLLK